MTAPDRSTIYERVLQFCGPAAWPQPWHFLGHSDAAGPVTDPVALTAALLGAYPPQALIHAGVIGSPSHGVYLLADPLLGDLFLPLRQYAAGNVMEILTAAGLLRGGPLPILAASEDLHVQMPADTAEGRLYAAGDIWDVAVLRALRLPATLVRGVAAMDLKQLVRLCRLCGLPHPAEPAGPARARVADGLLSLAEELRASGGWNRSRRRRLTLVAWSPSALTLELSADVAEAIAYLAQVAEHLREDLNQVVDIWRPTENELDRLELTRSIQDLTLMRRALHASSQHATPLAEHIANWQSDGDPASAYGQAFAEFAAAVQAGPAKGARERLRTARRKLFDFIDARIVAPLVDDAVQSASPIRDRTLKLKMAEVARAFFLQSAETSAAFLQLDHENTEGAQSAFHAHVRAVQSTAKVFASLKKQIDLG